MRGAGSVPPFWTDSPSDVDGYWVVTRYADVRKVLRNPDGAFSSKEAFIPKISMPNPMLPTESDPPDTRKYRSILLSEMTPDKVDPLEPRMREVCAEIIDSFKDRGHCDVVTDFAREYPIRIFVEFFGLPRSGGRSSATTPTPSCTLHLSGRRRGLPSDDAAEELASKRRSPKRDLLSAIANGEIDGELDRHGNGNEHCCDSVPRGTRYPSVEHRLVIAVPHNPPEIAFPAGRGPVANAARSGGVP